MVKVRVVKTASKAKAVQAIRYQNNKRIIVQHFGSAHNEQELDELLLVANDWVRKFSGQLPIFPDDDPGLLLHLNHCAFIGVFYTFFYEIINSIQREIGFHDLSQPMLRDLVSMRLFEPASKLRSLELLSQYFGIRRLRKNYYKLAPQWLSLKSNIEKSVVAFARRSYSCRFDLLFYDVTTLYFEAFEEDGLRKNGFSKDNKSQQPQILVALMVTQEGFPIAYEVFSGNTFEGHTIVPVIKNFIQRNQVKEFTVVADAAMISSENITELLANQINYIVGARLGNLSKELIEQIDREVSREDGKSIRKKTDNGYLICGYSSVRYRKDKHEMEKQIEKARLLIKQPSKNRKVKFTKVSNEKVELNQELIEKTRKLLGIKGYYTNIKEETLSNQCIIDRYHELYRIEQAFRISKNDLQTRPIFHFKEEPIKLHILVCFMALVIAKHIELKTGVSVKKFIDESKKITDGRILNQITNKEIRMKAVPTEVMLKYVSRLGVPH